MLRPSELAGAFTELCDTPDDPEFHGLALLAEPGGLSPHSCTSLLFGRSPWPIKPDICMEGGNVLTDGTPGGFHSTHPLLSLPTTGIANDLDVTSANATSAATAQASRLAALAIARYPAYWPETVRGLLVHAAEWTPAMTAEIQSEPKKAGRLNVLRRYGWGVPREETVLNSSNSAVTLVSQDRFVPFDGSKYLMPNLRMHTLPWPREVLEGLGAAEVRLRVTLSYFIEPSASRRGWRQRYSYSSHGLRFDVQGPQETQAELIARINKNAQAEEDGSKSKSTAQDRWFIGPNQRNLGSLHQDEWHGAGAELAACNAIAVYPVGGWWKYSSHPDRRNKPVRYALLLSLKTAEQEIDLYTPIANQLTVPVPVQIAMF